MKGTAGWAPEFRLIDGAILQFSNGMRRRGALALATKVGADEKA